MCAHSVVCNGCSSQPTSPDCSICHSGGYLAEILCIYLYLIPRTLYLFLSNLFPLICSGQTTYIIYTACQYMKTTCQSKLKTWKFQLHILLTQHTASLASGSLWSLCCPLSQDKKNFFKEVSDFNEWDG